jgi:EAL domain-containing protein (putative c-di-GMP-specific phosphodiesterase class I)
MKIADIHFLVVEDHEFQREALVAMLAGLGARHIAEAVDGRAALAAMRAQTIDTVISDLDMPGMDGMEFIRHVGEAGMPVSMILSSVHDRALIASVGTMTEAYGIILLGAIEKPVTPQKLAVLIALHQLPVTLPPKAASVFFSEADISEALAARLFEPLFQPKVDVATGSPVGAEALARWYHPEQGILGPYAFIPALEANRRIDELTWMMLEKAAAACRDWRAGGLDMTVSVNLSLRSLIEVGIADRVTALVRAQDLEPKHMTLEVTETTAMTDMARVLENLARLRIKGFGLSIDDYGTGYSSLQQLSRIPFTELKIDQSFVMHAVEKDACRVILESSLDIAKKLGLQAVAEGVETRADWELLKGLGCDVAQGYFIARPMEAAKIAAWVAAWTERSPNLA